MPYLCLPHHQGYRERHLAVWPLHPGQRAAGHDGDNGIYYPADHAADIRQHMHPDRRNQAARSGTLMTGHKAERKGEGENDDHRRQVGAAQQQHQMHAGKEKCADKRRQVDPEEQQPHRGGGRGGQLPLKETAGEDFLNDASEDPYEQNDLGTGQLFHERITGRAGD